ncbi:MAG TPA: RNA polymerase sigma factor [Planctomycetota bacterium]|nr:RNA polymerase sigma factor [Planctomycetota bacterium]
MPETNDERDKRLFREFRTRDGEASHRAFTELYSRYAPAMQRFVEIFFQSVDSGRVDEVCHRAWMKIMRKETPYQETAATWAGWAKIVTRSQCLMFLRKEKRAKEAEKAYAKNRPAAAPEEDLDLPLDKQVLLEQAMKILAEIPDKQREAWLLRVHKELSFEEIGQVMGCSTPEAWRRVGEANLKIGEIVRQLAKKKTE